MEMGNWNSTGGRFDQPVLTLSKQENRADLVGLESTPEPDRTEYSTDRDLFSVLDASGFFLQVIREKGSLATSPYKKKHLA